MTNLEYALEDCLARLVEDPPQGTSGETRLEDCLALYPEQAGELRRLLMTVSQLERGRTVRAPSNFKARTRAQLRVHMAAHPRAREKSAFGFISVSWIKFRLVLSLAVLAALFLISGTALAQGALPGSAGYGWKLASERVWRVFQPDPLAADLVLANRRADELSRVASNPQAQAIALQGYRQALETLQRYTLPAAQPIIHEALAEQKQSLDQAGLNVPELNELLLPATSGPAPPVSTLAPPTSTPASPISTSATSASTPILPVATPAVPVVSTLVALPESTLALPALPGLTLPPSLPTSDVVSSTNTKIPTLALPLLTGMPTLALPLLTLVPTLALPLPTLDLFP